MNFKDYLTEEERLECWKVGMLRKMASCGIKPSDIGMEKCAILGMHTAGQVVKGTIQAGVGASKAVKNTAVTAFAAALLLGLPLGGILHYLDRTASNDSKDIEKSKAIRDAYQKAVAGLERGSQYGTAPA